MAAPDCLLDCQTQANCGKPRWRRRRIPKPIAPKPTSINAQVAGSGTALMEKLSVSKAFPLELKRSDVRALTSASRSEARRVGKECVSTFGSRCSPEREKKKT